MENQFHIEITTSTLDDLAQREIEDKLAEANIALDSMEYCSCNISEEYICKDCIGQFINSRYTHLLNQAMPRAILDLDLDDSIVPSENEIRMLEEHPDWTHDDWVFGRKV